MQQIVSEMCKVKPLKSQVSRSKIAEIQDCAYSRLQNKHRGTFINFWKKKLKEKKWKMIEMPLFDVKMS